VRADLTDLAGPAGLADGPEPALVLVACSGGADSLALAAATGFVAPRLGLRAGAVVVDHGWSAGSAQVAQQAADLCRGQHLDPVLVVVAGAAPAGVGPEAAARVVRYTALEAAADRLSARAVLLGHTRDDQAETVLLGLARGSGGRSLAGMPARRGRYRRPLLGLPRTATAACCTALGLDPWQDPANADPAYTRSRLRAMLPRLESELGPGVAAALARTADQLREDADALDSFAADLLVRARVPGLAVGQDALDCAVLAAAPDAVRRRSLLLAARQAGSPAGALGRRHVLAVDALVTRWRGQGAVHLPGGVVARRACGRVVLAPAVQARVELERE
jgi:tRNA(Ile)-lysidine synthase